MKTTICRMGNSYGVIIPKTMLAAMGAAPGDKLDVKVERGRLVMTRARRKPREGWAEESKALAEAGEGGLLWPEFGNEDDKDLTW